MRLSQLFGRTQRQVPMEAETVSHQLLLRAGLIQQLAAGIYSYLPLGWRALRKIEQIVREEMDAAGSQEILMPALQPLELWEESGRAEAFGPTLFRLKDRRDRWLCLGPTHEEVVTDLVRRNVRSYRDLPLSLYQIQTKFRDEPRPRGGPIRGREFIMKDAYSFDQDYAGLDASYEKMFQAYKNIVRRCGLASLPVEADSGAIGGKDSVEFMVVAESGENVIIYCANGDYAANQEKAESIKEPGIAEEPLPLEPIDTPGKETIDDLADFLNIPHRKTLKAVFYAADGELVFVVIRGDLEVNKVKLANLLKCRELRLATEEEVKAAGLVAGSASPLGVKGIKVIADDSVRSGNNFVAGANQPGVHLKNVNYLRDFQVDIVADIANAQEGDTCIRCGGKLLRIRGIEVGHVFKLGTIYSEKLDARYLDAEGNQRLIVMGCYGIGVSRLLAAAVEQNHDDKGIIWPASIAPYQVHLCALSMDVSEVRTVAEQLYFSLQDHTFEVLYDDRLESPGVKFNDADLLGMPIRLTVSPRTLESDSVEVKLRHEREMKLVPRKDIAAYLQTIFSELLAKQRQET